MVNGAQTKEKYKMIHILTPNAVLFTEKPRVHVLILRCGASCGAMEHTRSMRIFHSLLPLLYCEHRRNITSGTSGCGGHAGEQSGADSHVSELDEAVDDGADGWGDAHVFGGLSKQLVRPYTDRHRRRTATGVRVG